MPEIVKMMELCTVHVSEATAKLLDEGALDYPVYVKGEYGWIVPVLSEAECDPVPADLGVCLDYAEKHGCEWVMFDRDVDRIDDLPEYRW